MQLNIDFNINKIHYLQLEILKLESKVKELQLSKRAYKGWVKKKSKHENNK